MTSLSVRTVIVLLACASFVEAAPSPQERAMARRASTFNNNAMKFVVASTNVDGMTLSLALDATNIMAGDTLPAAMIVSNGSQVAAIINVESLRGRDTDIGDFVVSTELGGVLPKVFRGLARRN